MQVPIFTENRGLIAQSLQQGVMDLCGTPILNSRSRNEDSVGRLANVYAQSIRKPSFRRRTYRRLPTASVPCGEIYPELSWSLTLRNVTLR